MTVIRDEASLFEAINDTAADMIKLMVESNDPTEALVGLLAMLGAKNHKKVMLRTGAGNN